MYFTSGQNRAFERLMQEKPGYGVLLIFCFRESL